MSKWILGLCLISLLAFSACGLSEEEQALTKRVSVLEDQVSALEGKLKNLDRKHSLDMNDISKSMYKMTENEWELIQHLQFHP